MPGDLDILLGEFVPGFDIRPGQMVDHPASCDGLFEVDRSGQVSPDDFNRRALKIFGQPPWVAHHETNPTSSSEELPCQFLADEASRAQDENLRG